MTNVDGYDSFITFTDDYSSYGYIYPIKERSEVLDKFKIFKAEVENQHDLKIKIVRSDHGGEYYGRHTPYDQVPGPFARFLLKVGIRSDRTDWFGSSVSYKFRLDKNEDRSVPKIF